jgi:hypothetical protein
MPVLVEGPTRPAEIADQRVLAPDFDRALTAGAAVELPRDRENELDVVAVEVDSSDVVTPGRSDLHDLIGRRDNACGFLL